MASIFDKVDQKSMDDAMLERQGKKNPSLYEPGMSDLDADDSGEDFWESLASSTPPSTAGSPFGPGAPTSTGSGTGGFGSFARPTAPGTEAGSASSAWGSELNRPLASSTPRVVPSPVISSSGSPSEKGDDDDLLDKIFGLFAGTFLAIVKSFKQFDSEKRMDFGKVTVITAIVLAFLGLILALFVNGMLGVQVLTVSGFSVAVGVVVFMFAYDSALNSGGTSNNENQSGVRAEAREAVSPPVEPYAFETAREPVTSEYPDEYGDMDSEYEFEGEEEDFEDEDEYYEDDEELEDEDDFEEVDSFKFESPDNLKSAVAGFNYESLVSDVSVSQTKVKEEDILDAIQIQNGVVTREYLFNVLCDRLQNIAPDSGVARDIEEDSSEFNAWDSLLRSSALRVKPESVTEIPSLVEAKEKLFYIWLKVDRPKWLKPEVVKNILNEMLSVYGYDMDTGEKDSKIYGLSDSVGDFVYLRIIKGKTAHISLCDALIAHKEDVLNPNVHSPVLIGVNLEGRRLFVDFKDMHSLAITGAPRKGKSWVAKLIIFQLAAFNSPHEVQFILLDSKGKGSDFYNIALPHVRRFESSIPNIVEALRWVNEVESERRKKLITDAGCVDIKDLKEKRPDIELPYLYIFIDEALSLAEDMGSELGSKYQSYLIGIISKLAYLGIRLIPVVHVLKNQFIDKTVTDLITCRMAVCFPEEEIKKNLGVTKFEHKLSNIGDMAVKIDSELSFCHAYVLASTTDQVTSAMQFLGRLWAKIAPESIPGSWYETREKGDIMGDLIAKGSKAGDTFTIWEDI